jgi:membrane-associated phospholipid phosphatase
MRDLLQKFISEPFMFIGYFSGYIILITIVCILLYSNQFFWTYIYIFLFIINHFLIVLLQDFLKDPRPIHGKQFMEDEFHNSEAYGMPSGHTQTIFFSLVFFYRITRSIPWLIIMLFIAICTITQRWIYKKHTILQIIIGGIIGSSLGYGSYDLINDYKKNGYLIYNVSK